MPLLGVWIAIYKKKMRKEVLVALIMTDFINSDKKNFCGLADSR